MLKNNNLKKKSTLATHRATVLDHENVLWSWTLCNTRSKCIYIGKCIGVSREGYKLNYITMPTDDVIICYKKKRHANF